MLLDVATEADYPEVIDLINLAFRGNEGWAVEEKYIEGKRIDQESLEEAIADKHKALLLTYRDKPDGSLLGCVWLEPVAESVWYLGLLSVRPELQERKLGRQILEASEEMARLRGAHRMRISVLNIRETLLAWYERRAYVLTGEKLPFPYGNEKVGKPLRDDLEFLILEKPL